MRIALLGWYGKNNAGDDRLELALRQLLVPHNVIALVITEKSIPLLRHCDCAVIGGGSLFQNTTRKAQQLLRILKRSGIRRYALWGVGIDSYDDVEEVALAQLITAADHCVVRDQNSLKRA